MSVSFEFRLLASLVLCLLFALPSLAADAESGSPGKWWVYLGTKTQGESKGIYLCQMDGTTGKLTEVGLAAEVKNPGFLALHPDGKHLYSVSEITSRDGKPSGGVTAFEIDPKTGKLTKLNEQSSGGAGPCHLVVDAKGTSVLVANYRAGSVASLPLNEDGTLGPAVSVIQHEGSSADPRRQEGPHAHSVNLDPANNFAFVADLGIDKVLVYRFDPNTSKLTPHDPPFAKVAPKSGPRHFAFHPSTKYAYVINELANTVTGFEYDVNKGELKEIQTITTLPEDFSGTSHTAEVVVHPSGKFLYGSNRGHDSISIFHVDPKTGKLTLVGHQDHKIKTPRNFYVDPTGKFLIAASQASGDVVVFSIDQETGKLRPTGFVVNVPTPICVRMLRVPGS